MNYLQEKKELNFELVVDEYADDFKKEVIDIYFWAATERIDENYPFIVEDILLNLHPKYIVSGIYKAEMGDIRTFHKTTEKMNKYPHGEFDQHCQEELEILIDSSLTIHYEMDLQADISRVFDSHRLAYYDGWVSPISGLVHLSLQHGPQIKVW